AHLADVYQQSTGGQTQDGVFRQTEVAAECRRQRAATDRVAVGVIVVLAHAIEKQEGVRTAQHAGDERAYDLFDVFDRQFAAAGDVVVNSVEQVAGRLQRRPRLWQFLLHADLVDIRRGAAECRFAAITASQRQQAQSAH